MEVLKSGHFSHNFLSKELAIGLRKFANTTRNGPGMITCFGMVGKNKVLETIETLDKFNSWALIDDGFPYPQVFVSPNFVVVAGETTLYEIDGTGLIEKIIVSAGSTWSGAIFHDYAYFSNGVTTVIRDAEAKTYSEDSNLPTAMAICNFNGQVMLGAPDAGYYT